jgi:hypothetical protein
MDTKGVVPEYDEYDTCTFHGAVWCHLCEDVIDEDEPAY